MDIHTPGSGSVYEIDVAGTSIYNSFALPFRGGAIAFDGTNLYIGEFDIGDFDSEQIRVTTRSGTEVRTFSSGLRLHPSGTFSVTHTGS